MWSSRGWPPKPTIVPTTLDELVEHPELAIELPPAVATDLLGTCEAELVRLHRLRDTLLIRAVAGINGTSHAEGRPSQPERSPALRRFRPRRRVLK
jgi:hypothetical protein